MKIVSRTWFAVSVAFALAISLCCTLLLSTEAHAATNQSATNAIATMKTKQYYKPGGACPSGRNVGWLLNGSTNCDDECYALISGATKQLFGNHTFIGGVTTYGYKATTQGDYTCVGTLVDTPTTQPSLSQVKSLLNKAYPGDVIQFKGGPNSYAGSAQHTAMVESVDSGGIRIYQHANKPIHINSTYYSWDSFYNKYLNFNVYTKWNKGISLYHYKNYSKKFPSHTHNYTKLTKTSYSYNQGSGNKHSVTKTYQCSCGNTTTKTTSESCTYSNGKCTKCGITKTTSYTFKPITIEEGVYSIRIGKDSTYVVDIASGSTKDGANAQLYKYNGTGAQLFSFVRNSDDGTYSIINIKSGKALTTQAWTKEKCGNICQDNWITGHANKRWYIGKLSDGTYIFKNKHSGLFLECKGGVVANGTNLQQYSGNYENNNFKNAQKWTLVKSSAMDTSIVQLKANENTISTTWKKQQDYNDGFQIRYATKQDMSNAKVVTEPHATSLGKSVSGFEPETTYYVQVRTYKHPSGSNGWLYSAWSTKQSVKTARAKDVSLGKATASFSSPSLTYTGSALKPVPTVKVNGATLKNGTDYTVSYSGNTNVGTAKVTITGKGNYSGTKTATFKITAAPLSKTSVSGIAAKTYTGKAQTQKPIIKFNGKTLKSGTDYTLSYKNNKKSGKATVTIKGKGNYSGSISKSFNIKPAKVTSVKAKSKSKGRVAVSWSNSKGKSAGVTGYKIVIKSGSKTIKTQYVSGSSAKSKTVSVANKYKGKKVKVYVYAYKTIDKTKVCSSASSAVSMKVKK